MWTSICAKLGIEIPIILAPMSGAAMGTALAAAVSNAGGLGQLHLWRADIATVRARIREIKGLTAKPFAVNLNMEFPQDERLEVCLEEGVPVISFFWRNPGALVARAKAGGAKVLYTIGSAEDAQAAVEIGVDIIVAQGWEAGGHVRGKISTMALVPAVVDAVHPVPVVAAGGIADGRGMAAALALGASGVWIGTRFLLSEEATIHPHYRERLLAASASDTVYLENLYDLGWPDAPHRVIRNRTITQWEDAGRLPSGQRPGEHDVVGTSSVLGDIVRYRPLVPTDEMVGEIDEFSLFAGQGVGLVKRVQPAADIVQEIYSEATAVLKRAALQLS